MNHEPGSVRDAEVIGIFADAVAARLKAAEGCPGSLLLVDPCRRHEMIETAAYFKAERRGFMPGNELGDWLEAEREIAEKIECGELLCAA